MPRQSGEAVVPLITMYHSFTKSQILKKASPAQLPGRPFLTYTLPLFYKMSNLKKEGNPGKVTTATFFTYTLPFIRRLSNKNTLWQQ